MKQLNNLKIKYNKIYNKYQVINPKNIVLEEFDKKDDAINWAKTITDFNLKRKNNSEIL